MKIYVIVKRSIDALGHSTWDTYACRTEEEVKQSVKALHDRAVGVYAELFPHKEVFDDYVDGAMKFEIRPKGETCAVTIVGTKENNI